MEIYETVDKLGMLVVEEGPGWRGTEGCAAMLDRMNTDDDKDVQADYIEGSRFRSGK